MLWKKYFELYLNSIKRITFFIKLQDELYLYKDNLGGLCLTCVEYGYDCLEHCITNAFSQYSEIYHSICAKYMKDVWFTSSIFETVFNNLNKKLLWIKIVSDNGAHYHCTELMSIIAN
ncbi:hypothetical protein Glove_106g64 [Diversispora epigaea]|uniref:Uncharacterized protein n=1 Tax=Diversispora epigaea TaxID=1348612 RepID=A0A397J2Y5_9GLOM|nr:hypothetical protein Glove_106g64 [Diversispora epigaea]